MTEESEDGGRKALPCGALRIFLGWYDVDIERQGLCSEKGVRSI
jgi:hypothetical protein